MRTLLKKRSFFAVMLVAALFVLGEQNLSAEQIWYKAHQPQVVMRGDHVRQLSIPAPPKAQNRNAEHETQRYGDSKLYFTASRSQRWAGQPELSQQKAPFSDYEMFPALRTINFNLHSIRPSRAERELQGHDRRQRVVELLEELMQE